jgi:hypothetical protein
MFRRPVDRRVVARHPGKDAIRSFVRSRQSVASLDQAELNVGIKKGVVIERKRSVASKGRSYYAIHKEDGSRRGTTAVFAVLIVKADVSNGRTASAHNMC